MNEDDNSLAADKWVRIMCDNMADGVWNRQGEACGADDLPVSEDVIAMIRGWQAWYEYADMREETRWFDVKAHAALGLFIARLVKRQLPDWTVVYFDESKLADASERDPPRHSFEYEIAADEDGKSFS